MITRSYDRCGQPEITSVPEVFRNKKSFNNSEQTPALRFVNPARFKQFCVRVTSVGFKRPQRVSEELFPVKINVLPEIFLVIDGHWAII